MARSGGGLLGHFLLRKSGEPPDGGPLLARIEGELYALIFSDRARAERARLHFGVPEALLFYVCAANREEVLADLRKAGARGFIADYDPQSATFAGAGSIPYAA